MVSVSVAEAKAKFAALLKRVEAGEVIAITRRGKPVAQLVPSIVGVAFVVPPEPARTAQEPRSEPVDVLAPMSKRTGGLPEIVTVAGINAAVLARADAPTPPDSPKPAPAPQRPQERPSGARLTLADILRATPR